MTNAQRRFADEYLIDCNATRAYRAVYPKCKKDETAAVSGNRLLKNIEVKTYINEQLDKISDEKVADAKEITEYLTSVLRGRSSAEIVVIESKGDGHSLAKHVKKAPDERERLKAAELLGKRYGLFKETLAVSGALPVVISGGDELED